MSAATAHRAPASAVPPEMVELVERFDPAAFDLTGDRAVIRLSVTGGRASGT